MEAPASGGTRALSRGLIRSLAILALSGVALAACDEDNGGGGGGDGDGVSQGIDTLGADFVEVFNQDPNDDPIDADSVDLRLNSRIEPFDP